jgi:Tfp pilus assembly protein PilO
MDQNLINLLIGIVGAIVGWTLKVIWSAIQELQADMKEIEKELHTEYVSKGDFHVALDEIKDMFKRIFDKLDNKADK